MRNTAQPKIWDANPVTYVDRDLPLEIIKPPQPPQRVLLAPKGRKPVSTSDIPVYNLPEKTDADAPGQRHIMAVIKAAAPNNPVVRNPDGSCKSRAQFTNEPQEVGFTPFQSKVAIEEQRNRHRKALNSGYMQTSQGKNWISDLVDKTFRDVVPIIQFHHMPYRIIQVDGVMMYNEQRVNRAEILLTLSTGEGFAPSSISGPGCADDRRRDQLRVGSWLCQNTEKAVVTCSVLAK
jgi:hypothetical protein